MLDLLCVYLTYSVTPSIALPDVQPDFVCLFVSLVHGLNLTSFSIGKVALLISFSFLPINHSKELLLTAECIWMSVMSRTP